jgi:hypothetical protein
MQFFVSSMGSMWPIRLMLRLYCSNFILFYMSTNHEGLGYIIVSVCRSLYCAYKYNPIYVLSFQQVLFLRIVQLKFFINFSFPLCVSHALFISSDLIILNNRLVCLKSTNYGVPYCALGIIEYSHLSMCMQRKFGRFHTYTNAYW